MDGDRQGDQTLIVPMISSTWNTIVRAKTTSKGTIAESKVAKTFFELMLEADISSLEESSMIKRMAISAPPMPTLMAVVIETALLVAAVVDALTVIMDMLKEEKK